MKPNTVYSFTYHEGSTPGATRVVLVTKVKPGAVETIDLAKREYRHFKNNQMSNVKELKDYAKRVDHYDFIQDLFINSTSAFRTMLWKLVSDNFPNVYSVTEAGVFMAPVPKYTEATVESIVDPSGRMTTQRFTNLLGETLNIGTPTSSPTTAYVVHADPQGKILSESQMTVAAAYAKAAAFIA